MDPDYTKKYEQILAGLHSIEETLERLRKENKALKKTNKVLKHEKRGAKRGKPTVIKFNGKNK